MDAAMRAAGKILLATTSRSFMEKSSGIVADIIRAEYAGLIAACEQLEHNIWDGAAATCSICAIKNELHKLKGET